MPRESYIDKSNDPDVYMNLAMPRSLRQWLSRRARAYGMSPSSYVRWLMVVDRDRHSLEEANHEKEPV